MAGYGFPLIFSFLSHFLFSTFSSFFPPPFLFLSISFSLFLPRCKAPPGPASWSPGEVVRGWGTGRHRILGICWTQKTCLMVRPKATLAQLMGLTPPPRFSHRIQSIPVTWLNKGRGHVPLCAPCGYANVGESNPRFNQGTGEICTKLMINNLHSNSDRPLALNKSIKIILTPLILAFVFLLNWY